MGHAQGIWGKHAFAWEKVAIRGGLVCLKTPMQWGHFEKGQHILIQIFQLSL